MKNIYIFTEDNDWEGESWNFLVSLTKEEYHHLKNAIDWDIYSIEESSLTPEDVEDFISRMGDENSYMPEYMDLTMCNKWLKPILTLTEEDVLEDDIFYKGRFWLES